METTQYNYTESEIIERAVGQPMKGKPDCYKVSDCAKHLRAGSEIQPQGEGGPLFVKERFTDPVLGVEVGLWRHVSGRPGSLRGVLGQ